MTYPVSVWEEARADIAAVPERELQLAALRAALALRENPWVITDGEAAPVDVVEERAERSRGRP